jgi:hypothetical protein
MASKFRIMSLTAIVGLALVSGAQTQGYPQITVIVRASAGIPIDLISDAEDPATRTFEKAGVPVQWLNCFHRDGDFLEQACAAPLTSADLVIQVVPRAQNAADSVFGVSFVDADGGVFADIFFDRVKQLHAQNPQISFSRLLGSVIAHELGHLLLGEHSHSSGGLMQAHWRSEQLKRMEMGNLLFDATAAAQLRSRAAILRARTRPEILASDAGN